MAKQKGRGAGRPRGRGKRGGRPGRRERSERGAPTRETRGRRATSEGGRDEEGRVVDASAPSSDGQWLDVETREGERFRVECLGEPVEVGARIAFRPTGGGATSPRRGVFTRILEDERRSWVARVVRGGRGGGFYLIPFAGLEAPRLELRERDAKEAKAGDRVLVVPLGDRGKGRGKKEKEDGSADRDEGRSRGSRARRHRGQPGGDARGLPVRVVEVFGPAGNPDADHRALVWKHRLPTQFSRRARLETEALDPAPRAGESEQRIDLRALPFVTIDPARAKDHDDAVFAEVAPSEPALRAVGAPEGAPAARWSRRLWVAIADVAHYVEAGGFLDADARRRGNSFYFPDRALPMLPERLSSDLCSLRPDVDRRAMVAELRLDDAGRVLDALFHEAWIRSHARLSYEDAAEWLDGGLDAASEEPVWGPSLRCLVEIAHALSAARSRAGALELDLPEVELVVDAEGRPIDARIRERNRAHGLIEEAMLAANRAVAKALTRADRPTLHRVHPPPSPRKLDALAELLERHGIEAPEDLEAPGVLAGVLEAARGQPFEERLHVAVLRSMSQARYEAEPQGHFALRFDDYLHFTSPIRRYADLEVHRALRRLLRGEREPRGASEGSPAADAPAVALAAWLSGRERVAQEAERDAEALASCALMAGREGESYAATITGATEFGVFVRLNSPAVSGLVPMRALAGQWEYLEAEDALVQAGGRGRLTAGEEIRVRLVEVDPDRARLAFAILGRFGEPPRRGGGRGRR